MNAQLATAAKSSPLAVLPNGETGSITEFEARFCREFAKHAVSQGCTADQLRKMLPEAVRQLRKETKAA